MSTPADRLDPVTHARVFAEQIAPESRLHTTTQQEAPRAIVLAGQPGAGKGNLANAADAEFAANIVKIDPDELREYHPDFKQLREAHPYTWSQLTQKDAGAWSGELRDAAIEGRRNLLIDTTLGDGNSAIRLVKGLQKQGYEVEVRVLAAHRLESELGVDRRFMNGLDRDGHGRYVPQEVRDRVYKALPGNLNQLHASAPELPIRIFNREGKALYDSHASDRTPGDALTQARQDRLTQPKHTRSLNEDWQDQHTRHQQLPEALERNPKVAPPTAHNLLAMRDELKVVPEIERNARHIAMLDETVRVHPQQLAAKGLAVAGTAAMAYDATTTAQQASRLHDQGNRTGAQSQVMHFGSRNLGMFGGAALGAQAGAALGVESGPGALITGGVGGIVGAIAGDKLAEAMDRARIYNQPDKAGHTWHYDPQQPARGWTRTVSTGQIDTQAAPDPLSGMPAFKTQTLTADARLAQELSFKASGTAVELALAHAPRPQDPFTQRPAPGEVGRGQIISDWTRDPQSKAWSRTVMDTTAGVGGFRAHAETASPQQAAQLERAAEAVMASNAAQSPVAMARRFQNVHEQSGWSQFGPPPQAVTGALQAQGHKLQASDGHEYTRGADGQWNGQRWHGGSFQAEGNVRDELQRTDAHLRMAPGQTKPAPGIGPQMAPQGPGPEHPAMHSPGAPQASPAKSVSKDSTTHEMFEALMSAVANKDHGALRQVGSAYLASDMGQTWLAQGRELNRQQAEAQAQQAAQQAALEEQAQQQTMRQSMRMRM